MSIAASASLDMRGKTITTFIAYGAAKRLAAMADGQALELLTDPGDDIGNDIRAWCRASGLDLVSADRADGTCQYVITRQPPRRSGRRLAAVISDPGLEELLSPLGFALAGALEGIDVALYFQGPAVRVLAKGFTEKLHGPGRPFSRFGPDGAHQGRAHSGAGENRPATGAWRPPLRLRALDAALQSGQGRPGLRSGDHLGVPDLHGNHGTCRHPPIRPVTTPDRRRV